MEELRGKSRRREGRRREATQEGVVVHDLHARRRRASRRSRDSSRSTPSASAACQSCATSTCGRIDRRERCGGARERDVAQRLRRIGAAVERRPVVEAPAGRGAAAGSRRASPASQRPVTPATADLARGRERGTRGMAQHVAVRGQDAGDLVAARHERAREAARGFAEPAGLRERRELPAREARAAAHARGFGRPRASRRQSTSNSSRWPTSWRVTTTTPPSLTVKRCAVSVGILADHLAGRHAHALVDDAAAQPRVAPDVHAREEDALRHAAEGVHAHVVEDHRAVDLAAGDDRAGTDDRVDRRADALILLDRRTRTCTGPPPLVTPRIGHMSL